MNENKSDLFDLVVATLYCLQWEGVSFSNRSFHSFFRYLKRNYDIPSDDLEEELTSLGIRSVAVDKAVSLASFCGMARPGKVSHKVYERILELYPFLEKEMKEWKWSEF